MTVMTMSFPLSHDITVIFTRNAKHRAY